MFVVPLRRGERHLSVALPQILLFVSFLTAAPYAINGLNARHRAQAASPWRRANSMREV
jgi:hypothetical protein